MLERWQLHPGITATGPGSYGTKPELKLEGGGMLSKMDACYDRGGGSAFRSKKNVLCMPVLLSPKSWETGHFFLHEFSLEYLR